MINLPIITHEDELELAKTEQQLVKEIKRLTRAQKTLINSQQKYAENLTKANLAREMLNRTFRDVLKQMQTLVREKRSNIKDEEVKLYEGIIHQNDTYVENTKKYIDAIKNLTLKKEYFVEKQEEFADALDNVAQRRSTVIKKALTVEKKKNDLIEGEKMKILESEFNDIQREFDRARDVMIKNLNQFLQERDEVDNLWMTIKDSVSKMS
ncbi:MAG: hypothetical protein EU533_05065 [Promethearchaeota archaeon]|nr:MAG: hypothetical protein EU533_05065 [Candidatus Lokiarchaeota archaeon]